MLDIVFDMETQDPDDFLTLLLLLGHPDVRLKAVTVTPGSPYQVALVRRALSWFDADIPVGAHNIEHPKTCVSSWHYRAYGPEETSTDAEFGGDVLYEVCDAQTTLVTGAPLKNLGAAMFRKGFRLGRLVAQGGFAGEGVVPRFKQLEKFKGLKTCPTFNLNGAPKAALKALEHPGIGARWFVSKNVCHGVIYTEAMHAQIADLKKDSPSLSLIWKGMETYLAKKRSASRVVGSAIGFESVRLIDEQGQACGLVSKRDALERAQACGLALVQLQPNKPLCRIMKAPSVPVYGKKLHDPLAACCAIDPSIGEWAEVELYRERGRWGARLAEGSGTRIIVDYDHDRFMSVLTASSFV